MKAVAFHFITHALKRGTFQGPRAAPAAHLGSEGGSTCAQDRAPHPAARGARQSGDDVGEAEQTRTGENTVVCRAAGAAAPRHSNGLWHVGGGVHAVTLKCPDIWGE